VNAFGDSGYGIFSQAHQSAVIGGVLFDWTSGNVNTGNGGYSSGGTLAAQIGSQNVGALLEGGKHISIFAYLGIGDANTATTAPNLGRVLTVNGVTYSTAAVESGNYCFWGNEYLVEKNSDYLSNDPADLAAAAIQAGFPSAVSSSIIQLSAMQASRSGPTGPCAQ
jgi:hypothetical protein